MREQIRLYAPGAYTYPMSGSFVPNLVPYLHTEDDTVRPAMIVVPGGGYAVVSPTEGEIVAERFYEAGYQCFVLTYTTDMMQVQPVGRQALEDISRAVRMVRLRAAEWHIDPGKVVCCGFSAGAHVVASLAVHGAEQAPETKETAEIRNVNRLYPGNENGVLTEQVCAGIKNMIVQENVSIVMDMHEGSPEFFYLDTTMAHERALNVASLMAMDMGMEGLDMKAELSGRTSYGLSHRSLGDNTDALMTLMETYNPSMGPLHGKMDDDLIINGNEPNYYQAHLDGYIYYRVKENGIPLIERIARHIVCITKLKDAYNLYYPEAPIEFTCLGSYDDMMELGLEGVFKPVK